MANSRKRKTLSSPAYIESKVRDHSSSKAKFEEIPEQDRINQLMQQAYIPGMSVATIQNGKIYSSTFGTSDAKTKKSVTPNTVFWACSLSKPVFAYLILRLIEESKLNKNFLDEPLPWDEEHLGPQGDKKPLTPRMILSHQSGLPHEREKPLPLEFVFDPGENFKYSTEGYVYLQKMITKDKSLEELAKTYLFEPLGMIHSSFLYPENIPHATTHDEGMAPNPSSINPGNNDNAGASLYTTAMDYALFLNACLKDKSFLKLIQPQIKSMKKDVESSEKKLKSETLKPIDWGLGFGLQKNEMGEPIAAFHWGHGPGARNFFTVKLGESPSAFVYLTNSDNGLSIAEDLANLTVGDISSIMNFLSEKYGYEKSNTPEWRDYFKSLTAGIESEKKGNLTQAKSLYQKAFETKPNNVLEHRFKWIEAQITLEKPAEISLKKLEILEGQYGSLKIAVKESKLELDVGGTNGKQFLTMINENTFLDEKGKVILTFNHDGSGLSLQCHFPYGTKCTFNKSPSITDEAMIKNTLGVSSNTAKRNK